MAEMQVVQKKRSEQPIFQLCIEGNEAMMLRMVLLRGFEHMQAVARTIAAQDITKVRQTAENLATIKGMMAAIDETLQDFVPKEDWQRITEGPKVQLK